MTDRRPHTLHLTVDDKGWLAWSLDCPYSATEVENVPGRRCNLLTENPEPYPTMPDGPDWTLRYGDDLTDSTQVRVELTSGDPVDPEYAAAVLAYKEAVDEYEPWVPMPGCFAKQYLEESGEWDEVVRLDATDPSFPVQVDIEITGQDDDAYVSALVPWKVTP